MLCLYNLSRIKAECFYVSQWEDLINIQHDNMVVDFQVVYFKYLLYTFVFLEVFVLLRTLTFLNLSVKAF